MSTIPLSFAQLSAPPSEDALLAGMLSRLQFYGYPVTSWQSGSVGRTIVQVDAHTLAQLALQQATAAQNSFLVTAAGDWLDAIATQFFAEARYQGASSNGYVTVTDSQGTGPHAITVGALWVSVGASGLRYNNTATAIVPLGGAVLVPVQAESIGAQYNVANGAITVVGSAGYPGITVSNPPISAPGSMSVSGTASGSASVYLTVVAGGVVSAGATTYTLSTDGGATFGAVTAMPSLGAVLVNGVTFTFTGTLSGGDVAIATLTTGSAAAAASYLSALTISNTWIASAGLDVESDASLRARCTAKWSAASNGATRDAYVYWSKTASQQVTKVTAQESVPATGIVLITLAGASGGVSNATLATVRSYLDQRRPLTTSLVVQSATPVTVAVAGTVYVKSAYLSNAQSEVAANFATLTASLEMGATVYKAELIQRVMDATGVDNFSILSPTSDTPLASNQVASFSLTGLTWVVV